MKSLKIIAAAMLSGATLGGFARNPLITVQLQGVYESLYGEVLDKRNFSKKFLSSGLLIRQGEKDKSGSRKGAYYYQVNIQKYYETFQFLASSGPGNLKSFL